MFFISSYKLFFFSRYLNFCLNFLVVQKNGMIRKIKLIAKFMTSQPEKQIIAIHILPNIPINKGKTQVMEQKMEYKMRNISLEKSYTKRGRKTISRPFSKKSKLSISLNQYSKFLYSLFLLYAKLRAIKVYWN